VKPARKYDLLALDLDGTLLDSQHAVPPANRAALHRAHAAGIKVVLCTGRAFAETRPVLEQIGLDLDAAVAVFGAVVADARSGRTLYRRPMRLPTAHAVTNWFQQTGYTVMWLTDADQAGTDGYVLRGPKRHAAVDRWIAWTPCRVQDVERLPAGCAAPVRLSIIDETAELDGIAQRLHAEFGDRLRHHVLCAPPYQLSLIEAFAPPVSKWYGVQKLCRRWRIDPQRTVAVGDDVNDTDMVQYAGLGVAMANANPALRAVADRETGSNDDCGVAQLVDEMLRGK
jgi:Cof subfamily protein (haloacid dehalogenase superfamily)